MKKCAIIYNPESGKIKSKNWFDDKFNSVLNDYGYAPVYYPTKKRGDATEIARTIENIDLLICCGGDGTLNETIRGNLKRKNKLLMAHLPFGTTNDVGAMYGYNKNHLGNLSMLLSGSKKKIDTCFINDRPFVYVACFGNYVDIAYNTPTELKKKYGRFGYILNALRQLRKKIRMYNVKFTIDGVERCGRYSFIFISNSSRIAGFDNVYKDVKLDDGKFEVLLCNFKNKKELLKAFTLALTTELKNIEGIEYYCSDNLTLEFEKKPKVSWCIDGEELKSKSKKYEFKIVKDIKMLLPSKNIFKLFKNTKEDV